MTAPLAGGSPPIYTLLRPHILVAPPPESASFFNDGAVEGEVFVKGLGTAAGARAVRALSAEALLVNRAPGRSDHVLYASTRTPIWTELYQGSASTPSSAPPAFPSIHQFRIHLPPRLSFGSTGHIPGTLDLSASDRGEVRWSLRVTLELDGDSFTEEVKMEGTPQEIGVGHEAEEAEAVLEKGGVRSRLLVSDKAPRLGSLLHMGLEVKAMDRKKTGVAGLSSQPDASATLRGLRRVRVELYRVIRIRPASSEASSSREAPMIERQHLTLLYASGKSLRFPGINNPPLRVLFTLPTAQMGATADGSWGEISMSTPYHTVSFMIRATFGFGALGEAAPPELQDWVLEQEIRILPRLYTPPRPQPGAYASEGSAESSKQAAMSDEELAKEAYRQKGLDIVGMSGTFRAEEEADQPPEFEAGPSHPIQSPGLPSFTESEAIAAVGQAPFPPATVSERGLDQGQQESPVIRPESLGGELASWVEYDGYETFSVAPPSVSASYGASGPMDPPQPDDEHSGVVGGIAARLGLQQQSDPSMGGLDLMERLGLGDGTRVVDMHDDLPPGIDEPSLPALPSFNTSQLNARQYSHRAADDTPPAHPGMHDISPPSFAASEAAQAVGGMATSIPRRPSVHLHTHPHHPTSPMARDPSQPLRDLHQVPETPPLPPQDEANSQAPPGYFGAGGQGGGPPAYS